MDCSLLTLECLAWGSFPDSGAVYGTTTVKAKDPPHWLDLYGTKSPTLCLKTLPSPLCDY